jgi:hypothetical protein
VSLLVQRTGDVFVMDPGEATSQRRVVEAFKRKDGVRAVGYVAQAGVYTLLTRRSWYNTLARFHMVRFRHSE